MTVPLSHDTFVQFRTLIYERMGLAFPDNKKYLLENRLQSRLVALHCRSFEDYFQYLQFDPRRQEEYVELANCVTTNETFFFRDSVQIDCLRSSLLPQAIQHREGERRLRIWSAGCSSGEEPYTLAMILSEAFPQLDAWNIDIVATDISEQVLQKAKQGIYGQYAIRNVPPQWLKKYFKATDGQYKITHQLRQRVSFSSLNLFDDRQMRAMRDFDIVLCRNVLIYFDEPGRKKIVSGFYDALRETGALMIGFSEALYGIARLFRPVPWNKTIIYFKFGMRSEVSDGELGIQLFLLLTPGVNTSSRILQPVSQPYWRRLHDHKESVES